MATCSIHVYLINEHFSQEYADIHNNGNESELNRRYEWQDELRISSNVEEVKMIENGEYPLQGTYGNGETFMINVPNMRLFSIITGGHESYIGCSESILDSCTFDMDVDFKIEIFLKDNEPMANPVPGIYIASQEFPKELIPDA